MRMTTFALATTAVLAATSPGKAIYEGPWCAHVMLEIRGQGASHCTQNPRYHAAAEPQRRKKQRLP